MTSTTPTLPPRVEETVSAIAAFHLDHDRRATALERMIDRLTAVLGRPLFLGLLTAAAALWLVLDLGLRALGRPPFDPPPFQWLQGLLTLLAVYMTALILITQRRADLLDARRAQLTLELSIVAEQKTAKVIQLLEEMRRDSPHLGNRVDAEAASMATPSDPQAVLEAIKEGRPDAAETAPGVDQPS